jgi:hypothetical protein
MLTSFQTCFASVAPTLGDATACGVLWQAAPGRFLLDVPDVARYLVSDGAVITIDRAPAARDQDVTHFLNMTPLAALLFQRGQLALHAAAVSPPSPRQGEEGRGDEVGAILIAGDSGAGKSTLLAALLQRGWTMMCDDLAPVQVTESGQVMIYPTAGDVRLWQDAREKLGFDQSSIVLTAFEVSAPQPLRAIHWLSIHYKDDVELDELAGAERFRAIGLLTYNSHIADALFDRAVYLRCATAVAQMAPMYRLRRPRGRWSVADLADRVVLTR